MRVAARSAGRLRLSFRNFWFPSYSSVEIGEGDGDLEMDEGEDGIAAFVQGRDPTIRALLHVFDRRLVLGDEEDFAEGGELLVGG